MWTKIKNKEDLIDKLNQGYSVTWYYRDVMTTKGMRYVVYNKTNNVISYFQNERFDVSLILDGINSQYTPEIYFDKLYACDKNLYYFDNREKTEDDPSDIIQNNSKIVEEALQTIIGQMFFDILKSVVPDHIEISDEQMGKLFQKYINGRLKIK